MLRARNLVDVRIEVIPTVDGLDARGVAELVERCEERAGPLRAFVRELEGRCGR